MTRHYFVECDVCGKKERESKFRYADKHLCKVIRNAADYSTTPDVCKQCGSKIMSAVEEAVLVMLEANKVNEED